MINRDFKKEFDDLVKEISPLFKERGFKKKSNYIYKSTTELIQIFNVQKSQWNSKEDISFTFNIGFFNPEIYKVTWDRLIPDFPKEYDCFINLRSGFITHKKDNWYNLNDKVSFDNLLSDIKIDIYNSALNLYDNHQTLLSLKELINKYPELKITIMTIPMFVFLMKTNSEQEALNFLNSEYKEALIPKSSISIEVYPDGRRIEKKSEPKINQNYIDSLLRIAKMYNIDIK